jgi:putative tryptophan/tyrosine transport system substrate-binding protein
MDRRAFVAGSLALLAAPLAVEAQQPGKVWRIGFLGGTSRTANADLTNAFSQGLRELGYVEGQNVVIEYRYAEGKYERFPAFVNDLVRLKVDVIVAVPTAAALAAKNATGTIPIVTVAVFDPVESGLVASLARPGKNVTGLTLIAGPEIVGKYLELLKESLPKASRVGVLWNPANTAHPSLVREAESSARALGLQLQLAGVRGSDEIDNALAAMARERVGALMVLPDSMFVAQRTRLAELATKHRLPAMYGLRLHAEAGGLMAYSANMQGLFRRAAGYVAKILKGAKPADLPVEQPTKFELVINLKTAKALGLTVPPSVLARADEIIQ